MVDCVLLILIIFWVQLGVLGIHIIEKKGVRLYPTVPLNNKREWMKDFVLKIISLAELII